MEERSRYYSNSISLVGPNTSIKSNYSPTIQIKGVSLLLALQTTLKPKIIFIVKIAASNRATPIKKKEA